ncbi:hypothetical protein AB0D66_18360 [Streptomyces sp. NPDC048270]|uniref:hypothetical protein n=1 Tax=Streptomyces sp. NPDC048270 TaxID=3154615 RepID=UPI0033DCEB1F
MKPPAELDTVAWHTLTHAYGPAEDVPDLIRALYQDDETAADEAIHELYGNIHHQGTVYPATAPAVPFLAHAVRHAPAKRDELLVLLATLADHDPTDRESPHWPGSSVAAICAELSRALPDLLPCLADSEREVRRAALRVVAAVADQLPTELHAPVVTRLDAVYHSDPVPAVRADAMVALALLHRTVEEPLAGPLPEIRLAAAILAAERSGPPYAHRLVEVFAQDGAEPDPGDDGFPWPGIPSQEAHLTDLLTRDPDAGLAVAAHWIAAGDLHSRGSWLAREIVETWRDREPEVLDLLLSALPHHEGTPALTRTLGTIASWAEHLPRPGAKLRDALYAYASAEGDTAEPALLALLRTRDPRALDLVLNHPEPQALRAASRAFPAAADLLIPVIRRELAAGATGTAATDLVEALGPFGTAAHRAQPELADCLRTDRAPMAAARRLGLDTLATPETITLLAKAAQSADAALRAAAAVAHHRLTGEAELALRTFEDLLSSRGPTHWYLTSLIPLGRAAAPLLPAIEPLLTAGHTWTRMAAAEAHHALTGTPDHAVPVLAELVSAGPVGLGALKALAAIGTVPEHLRPTLRAFAFSPVRLLGNTPLNEDGHPDEELRTLAWHLLAAG